MHVEDLHRLRLELDQDTTTLDHLTATSTTATDFDNAALLARVCAYGWKDLRERQLDALEHVQDQEPLKLLCDAIQVSEERERWAWDMAKACKERAEARRVAGSREFDEAYAAEVAGEGAAR